MSGAKGHRDVPLVSGRAQHGAALALPCGWRNNMRNAELWLEFPDGARHKVFEANAGVLANRTMLKNVVARHRFSVHASLL